MTRRVRQSVPPILGAVAGTWADCLKRQKQKCLDRKYEACYPFPGDDVLFGNVPSNGGNRETRMDQLKSRKWTQHFHHQRRGAFAQR